MSTTASLEVLALVEEGEWMCAKVAVDGTLAVPFSFHKSTYQNFKNEDDLLSYLTNQGRAMISNYGDARRWPEQGEVEVDENLGVLN